MRRKGKRPTGVPRSEENGRIRVLFVIKGLGPGGAEELLRTHLQLLDKARFEADLAYVFEEGTNYRDMIAGYGVGMTRLSRRNKQSAIGAVGLFRLLHHRRYDIIHLHSPLLASFARMYMRLSSRRTETAIVSTEHNVWHRYRRVTRTLNRLTIQLDDHVFAVSTDVRGSMTLRHPERAEVLIHGIDLAAFPSDVAERAKTRSELGIRPSALAIGCVAHFREQKNHGLLVDVLSRLQDRRAEFVCLLVGEGPLQDDIRERCESRGLGDKVRFLGLRYDIASLMRSFDVFVLTSLWEGLPVALMEALATGLPVVASDVGGIHEAVDGTGAGFLFDPTTVDPESIADELCRIADDPDLRRSMSGAARVAASRFDARRATDHMSDRYVQLVEQMRAGRTHR